MNHHRTEVSRLGYGCAALASAGGRRQCLRILGAALANGIEHFDVAPLYGMGRAEVLLGEFIAGKRDRVTIVSKLGMRPPQFAHMARRFIDPVKRALRYFPALDKSVRRKIDGTIRSGEFDPIVARQSLDASLRALRTDYLDVLLLHEATADDANNPALLEFLSREVSAGRILKHGVGGDFGHLGSDCSRFHPSHAVFQFQDNIVLRTVERLKNKESREFVTFGALQQVRWLQNLALANPESRDQTEIDLANASDAAGVLLRWSLKSNPGGMVLFSSTDAKHIEQNVRCVADQRYSDDSLNAVARLVATGQGAA